jgi:adenylate cyclase
MEKGGVERRLSAVLCADVVGYSRLMQDDDNATLRALTECRGVFSTQIEKNGGRIVNAPGDSVLAEFVSVVNAVECAVSIQRAIAQANAGIAESRRMQFRIGINLGDVLVDPTGIYGDGVNIAARLESLAPAGGICVSQSVRDQVRSRMDLAFEDMGEQAVKNIAEPVRAFRLMGEVAASPPRGSGVTNTPPERPSIAVLPFVNMSGMAEQEFFVDGLTEDILTELSRFHELFVISRNTSMKYKGQAVDVRKVGQELSVQYLIEGSVRRAGNRVRITVQLIDAESDRHIWAERYDRELEDIFALQDEITRAIVAVLPGRVEASTRDRAARKPTASMAAYECLVTAKVRHHRSTREDNAEAQRLVARALELDPQYAHAHAWRACILGQSWVWGWCEDGEATQDEVASELAKARALDDNDSDVHRVLAAVGVLRNNLDMAAFHQERALQLNPNDDLIVVQQGELLTWLGQGEEGAEWIRKAMRLNPFHPDRFWSHLGRAWFVARRYAEAIDALQRISAQNHQHWALLAPCHARLGDPAAAGALLSDVLKQVPGFNIREHVLPTLHYKRESDLAHHRDAMLQAGFRE